MTTHESQTRSQARTHTHTHHTHSNFTDNLFDATWHYDFSFLTVHTFYSLKTIGFELFKTGWLTGEIHPFWNKWIHPTHGKLDTWTIVVCPEFAAQMGALCTETSTSPGFSPTQCKGRKQVSLWGEMFAFVTFTSTLPCCFLRYSSSSSSSAGEQ